MNNPSHAGQHHHQAFTLVEVLVAMAAATVIFGVAMGILLTTNQSSDRILARQALLQHAQLTMKEIRAVIENAAWPEDLASTQPAGAAAILFAKDSVALISSHQPTTTGQFCCYAIGHQMGAGAERLPEPALGRSSPGGLAAPKPGEGGPKITPYRSLGGQYQAAIAFRYATEVGEDFKPVWREQLNAGEKPHLIWVELLMRDSQRRSEHEKVPEIRLTTAVSL